MSGHPVIHQARVWLDDDGRHIWLEHICSPPDGELERTMLPDTWSADDRGDVSPSISCTRCGLHGFFNLRIDGPVA